MNSSISQDTVLFLVEGDTAMIHYHFQYDSLALLNDEFVLQIELPCGNTWVEENELLLDGQAPISIEQSGVTQPVITATYQLPFLSDTFNTTFSFVYHCELFCQEVCRDSLASSCQILLNKPPLPRSIGVNILAIVNRCASTLLYCNHSACDYVGYPFECNPDSICLNEPPGYVISDFTAMRGNYGLPDSDNDRLPDGTGPVDFNQVATHRLIAGDTFLTRMAGEVVIDATGTTLPFGHLDMTFSRGAFMSTTNSEFFNDGTGIDEAGIKIRIFDSSTGINFECDNVDPAISEALISLQYRYDISALALGCLPDDFEYSEGDSIIFEGGAYKLIHNLQWETDGTPLYGQMNLVPNLFIFDENFEDYDSISCECAHEVFEISGYRYLLTPDRFGLPLCDTSQYVGSSIFQFEMAENNFFLNEYRNFVFAKDWRLTLPDGVSLVNARLRRLRYQNGASLFQNEPLGWEVIGDEHVIDFGLNQDPPIDEAFLAVFQYIFDTDCELEGSLPFIIRTHLDFLNSMPEAEDPFDMEVSTQALRTLTPNLTLTAANLNCNLISFNDRLNFEFVLENTPTTVGNETSEDAPNTWMYITSQSGLVTDLQLIDSLTGLELPLENGIYQLDDFPIGTWALRFTGINNSCEMENLTIHFGWSCDPIGGQLEEGCYRRSKPLTYGVQKLKIKFPF